MDRLSNTDTLRLRLMGAENDLPISHPDRQTELRQFYDRLLARHERVGAGLLAADWIEAETAFTGDFLIPIAKIDRSSVGNAVLVWLGSRPGRRVHAQIGVREALPKSLEELDDLIDQCVAPCQERHPANLPNSLPTTTHHKS